MSRRREEPTETRGHVLQERFVWPAGEIALLAGAVLIASLVEAGPRRGRGPARERYPRWSERR